MSNWEEGGVDIAKQNRVINTLYTVTFVLYVLGEPIELAGPDFLCIVIVDDIVVGFEAAMVEIRVVVNTGIIVIGIA